MFCVFFKDPAGRLTAGVVDAAARPDRRPIQPGGLAGWAWGELRLAERASRPCDILGRPGEGMDLLREHFAHYRPLVAATALGAAAAVHDQVAAHLGTRQAAGVISRPRDNALITLGRAYAQINAALLAALTAQRLAETGDQQAELWGCAAKAHGVNTAYAATSELTLLAGAAGCTASSPLAKARRDLRALLYADGIHDGLYRAAGRALLTRGGALCAGAISQLDCHPPAMPPSRWLELPGRPRSSGRPAASPALAPGPGARRRCRRVPPPGPGSRRSRFGVSTPPSYTTIRPSGRSGRDGTQSSATHPARRAGLGRAPQPPPAGTLPGATPQPPPRRREDPRYRGRQDLQAAPVPTGRGTKRLLPSAYGPAMRHTRRVA